MTDLLKPRNLKFFSIGLILFDLALALWLDPHIDNLIMALIFMVWEFTTLGLAASVLLFLYRSLFMSWRGWLLSLVVFAIVNFAFTMISSTLGYVPIYLSITMLTGGWVFIIATILFFWRQDAGLMLVAWSIMLGVWISLIAWTTQGNMVERIFNQLEQTGFMGSLWWFSPLMCSLSWIILVGVLSFIGHTVRLLAKE